MTIEGELTVRLAWDGKRVIGVDVRSTRPFMAQRLFAGKTPAAAAAMAPLLYSVCEHAQGVAAAGALEAGTGREPAAGTIIARRQEVILEAIQEFLWRLLIDWPLAMSRGSDVEPVAAVRRVIAPALAALAPVARRIDGEADPRGDMDVRALSTALAEIAGKHVYGVLPEVWLARADTDAIAARARGGQTLPARLLHELLTDAPDLARSDIALMPAAQRDALVAAILPALRGDPGFAQAPTWDGSPVETGALARVGAHPFVAAIRSHTGNAVPARFAARLTELALLLVQLADATSVDASGAWADAFAPGAGEGLGAVQTARGL
ncbi:MAG: hypothetical protein ABI569_10760, partial [Casimicrobiaceae bacterium]